VTDCCRFALPVRRRLCRWKNYRSEHCGNKACDYL